MKVQKISGFSYMTLKMFYTITTGVYTTTSPGYKTTNPRYTKTTPFITRKTGGAAAPPKAVRCGGLRPFSSSSEFGAKNGFVRYQGETVR